MGCPKWRAPLRDIPRLAPFGLMRSIWRGPLESKSSSGGGRGEEGGGRGEGKTILMHVYKHLKKVFTTK